MDVVFVVTRGASEVGCNKYRLLSLPLSLPIVSNPVGEVQIQQGKPRIFKRK